MDIDKPRELFALVFTNIININTSSNIRPIHMTKSRGARWVEYVASMDKYIQNFVLKTGREETTWKT
jgi:hypothetical protein